MVVAHPFEVTIGPNTTTRILLSSSSFPAPLLPRLALETLLATTLDAAASPRQLREAMAASSALAFTAATFSSPTSFAASPTTTSPPTTIGPNTTTRILLSSSSSFPAPLLPRLALETLLAITLDAATSPRQLHEAMAASSASAFTAATFPSPTSFAASPTTTSPPTTTKPNTTTRILLSSSSSFPAPRLPHPTLKTLLATALDAAASPCQLCEAHGRILHLGLHDSNFLITRLLRRLTDHRIPTHPYPLLVFAQIPFPNSFLWTALIRGATLLLHSASSTVTHPIRLYAAMRRRWPPTPPLSFTFSALLKAYATIRSLAMGTQARF